MYGIAKRFLVPAPYQSAHLLIFIGSLGHRRRHLRASLKQLLHRSRWLADQLGGSDDLLPGLIHNLQLTKMMLSPSALRQLPAKVVGISKSTHCHLAGKQSIAA